MTGLPLETRRLLRAACRANLLLIRNVLDILIGGEKAAPPRQPAPSERAAARPRRPRRRRRPPTAPQTE